MVTLNKESRRVQIGISTAGTVLIVLAWHMVSDVFDLVTDLTLPGPVTIYTETMNVSSLIISNLIPTVQVSVVGFVAATVLGIGSAVVLTSNERVRNALMPLIVSGNSVPRVALAPVIIFYIGGFQAKYLVSAWIAFFPMLVNAMEGLGNLDDDFELLLDSLDATWWQEYRKVRFQNALPFLFDGMKIAVTLSIVGAVVGEYVAAEKGMGFLALFALRNLEIPLVFGIVGVMGLVSVAAFYTLFKLQNRIVHWRQTDLLAE